MQDEKNGSVRKPDFLMNSLEAAEYLGTTPTWLRTARTQLEIPAFKVGRQLRFRRSELDIWLEQQCR